jgi:hypothetical protein
MQQMAKKDRVSSKVKLVMFALSQSAPLAKRRFAELANSVKNGWRVAPGIFAPEPVSFCISLNISSVAAAAIFSAPRCRFWRENALGFTTLLVQNMHSCRIRTPPLILYGAITHSYRVQESLSLIK